MGVLHPPIQPPQNQSSVASRPGCTASPTASTFAFLKCTKISPTVCAFGSRPYSIVSPPSVIVPAVARNLSAGSARQSSRARATRPATS